jgi:hypothetical protein
MDTARVLEDSGPSPRRPSRRGRWLVAAALACFAAPLASGSAIALSGGSGSGSPVGSSAGAAATEMHRAFSAQRDKRHRCRHGERGGARRGSSYSPEL